MIATPIPIDDPPQVGNMPQEVNLVQEAIANPDAFSDLYRQHLPNVYRYVLSRVGNVQDAEDITTQTFMGCAA